MGLPCPRCRAGELLRGRRAWGCSRWADGCRLVVPFEVAGRKVSPAQLRGLVEKGVTRKGKHGRLRLDLAADPPAVVVDA